MAKGGNKIRSSGTIHPPKDVRSPKPVKGKQVPDRTPSPVESSSSEFGSPEPQVEVPEEAKKFSEAFLPDAKIAATIFFRILLWLTNTFSKPINNYGHVNFKEQPKDKGILFYTRHSTHNADILPTAAITWEATGKVARMLLHRLILAGFPLIKYIGGVAGTRGAAVALLRAKFYTGVIPGGADEGLVGHENCYRLHWPAKRVGFAKVAMEADSYIVPYFIRNTEESRWNPIHEIWHWIRGYVLFDYLMAAKIPILTPFLYTLAHCIWFTATFIQIPIPVRCTMIFGHPVPYDREKDTTEDVVKRCHAALQQLIVDHQPNALEGRNYTRALAERWVEWRQAKPGLIKAIENATPGFIKRWLKAQAKGKKKSS